MDLHIELYSWAQIYAARAQFDREVLKSTSIGAVLGYHPISGSLRNAANKENYKFSDFE